MQVGVISLRDYCKKFPVPAPSLVLLEDEHNCDDDTFSYFHILLVKQLARKVVLFLCSSLGELALRANSRRLEIGRIRLKPVSLDSRWKIAFV